MRERERIMFLIDPLPRRLTVSQVLSEKPGDKTGDTIVSRLMGRLCADFIFDPPQLPPRLLGV